MLYFIVYCVDLFHYVCAYVLGFGSRSEKGTAYLSVFALLLLYLGRPMMCNQNKTCCLRCQGGTT